MIVHFVAEITFNYLYSDFSLCWTCYRISV